MSYDRFESQNRKRAMQNRSLAGRAYFQKADGRSEMADRECPNSNLPTSISQTDSPTNPPQKPEANNGSAAVSKLPTAAASSAVGKFLLALAAVATTWVCAASASPADTRWLDAVAHIESSNDSTATGDGGKARGMFQFHRDAWEVARGINPKVVEYYRGSTNAAQSRLAATAYLTWLRQRFAANGVAMPTDSQLYAAYNCGFAGFKLKYKFDVARTPKTTQRACAKLSAISRQLSARK